MQSKRGLGRGLESLIPPPIKERGAEDQPYRTVSVDAIVPNRLQPRTVFDEEKLRELADSIRSQGVLQPLIVVAMPDGRYELIAGERRLRASRMAELDEVPVIVKSADDEGLLALAIIENIQREDLNAIEEARAYQELIEQFNYTQEEASAKVGKSRVAVANTLRLLKLPRLVQDDVASGRYSAGHARALLGLPGLHEQLKMRERIVREMPTVRDVEKMVQSRTAGATRKKRSQTPLTPQMNALSESLKQALGTKVRIEPTGKGGKLTIEYYSAQDLDRIYRHITR